MRDETRVAPAPAATGGTSITLVQLATFLVVMETGSMSAAARRAGYSQSAVSLQVKSLERCLRATLFLREGGGVSPTGAARRLVEPAGRILRLVEETQGDLRSFGGAGATRRGQARHVPSQRRRPD